jgi:hypothetical protein
MVPAVSAAAPRSRTLGGSTMAHRTHPGDLKASIIAKDGSHTRPPAAVVTAKGTFWYSKWVITGTVPHRIRFPDQKARGVPKEQGNIIHPGNTHPNPYMTRGGNAGTPATMQILAKYIADFIDYL